MTHSRLGATETREAVPLSDAPVDGTAWGGCQIRLLADRVPSRRTGSTYKVYCGWRFAVAMDQGSADPCTTLFTIPIDALQLATSPSRYALVQLPHQGPYSVGEAAAFSWSTTSVGTTDPFAAALQEAHRQLEHGGWKQDASLPMSYMKTDPSLLGDMSALPSFALSSPRPGNAGLDDWETGGGTSA